MKLMILFYLYMMVSLVDFSGSVFMVSSLTSIVIPYIVNTYSNSLFLDSVSTLFMILSTMVLMFCVMSFLLVGNIGPMNFYSLTVMILMTSLIYLSFTTLSFFVFFITMEAIFLMMFYFLIKLGLKMERKISSYYMLFFTIFSSLPLLIFMVVTNDSMKYSKVSNNGFWGGYWSLFMILMFFVKIPIFGVHMWLPKAHVEAPLLGSIMLSGSLLKIGMYGFIRFSKFIIMFLSKWGAYVLSLSWLSALMMGFVCLRQLDIKSMVAYSSVVHMGVAFSGMMSMTKMGLKGSLIENLAHGFSSPLMFYMVYMLYNTTNTRSIILSKGGNFYDTLFCLCLFLVMISSLGVPPLASFFSELMSVIAVLCFSQITVFLSILILFLSGVYLLYYFVFFSHGLTMNPKTKYSSTPDFLCILLMTHFMFTFTFMMNSIY